MPDDIDPAGEFLRNLTPTWSQRMQELPIPPVRPATQVPALDPPIFNRSTASEGGSSSRKLVATESILVLRQNSDGSYTQTTFRLPPEWEG